MCIFIVNYHIFVSPDMHTVYTNKLPRSKKWTLTDDVYIGVGEEGAVFVGGPALVDSCVFKVDSI